MSKITEVAKLANVAKSTVSNVLSNKRFVSDEVREKVLKACMELNFKKNILASSLVTKRTNIIGLFLTAEKNRFDEFYGELIKGVSLYLSQKGYFLMLYLNVDNQEAIQNLLITGKMLIDGAIVLTPREDDFRTKELRDDSIPYVIIGRPGDMSSSSKYTVDVENNKITYDITKHLLSNNSKKPLFLNSLEFYTISIDRLKGFKLALESSDMPFDENQVLNFSDDISSREGIINALNQRKGSFDSIVVSSDINAKYVYEFAKQNNIEIGKDLAVAALGGDNVAQELAPPLTTVVVNYNEMGDLAAQMIIEILDEKCHENNHKNCRGEILFRPSSILKN